MPRAKRSLTDADYERLAELRYGLRAFLHWSAEQARRAGITPTQHQLLLAIRASREPRGATISDVADVLLIRHHSAVGLVDRAQEAGLITRERDPDQQSVVLENPMSSDQAQLRTTLIGSLLDAAGYNHARSASDIRLFEAGPVYLPVADQQLPREPYHLGALLIGAVRPRTWLVTSRPSGATATRPRRWSR